MKTSPDAMPSSITELRPVVEEFTNRLRVLEHEIETLNEQKKELVEEYSDRLDTKTLKLALRAVALKDKVQHKDTFDTFVTILTDE